MTHIPIGSKESITPLAASSTTAAAVIRRTSLIDQLKSTAISSSITITNKDGSNINNSTNKRIINNLNSSEEGEEPEFTAIDLSGIEEEEGQQPKNSKSHYTKESFAELSMWKQYTPTALLVPNPRGRVFLFCTIGLSFVSFVILDHYYHHYHLHPCYY